MSTPPPPAQPAVAAPGSNTLSGDPPIDNFNPPANSPYLQLPAPLRLVLSNTFVDAAADKKDALGVAAKNMGLQNTVAGCKSTWDALDHAGPFCVCTYRRIYERVIAIDPKLWDLVMWIRWTWLSTSLGFYVRYKDRAATRAAYSGGAKGGSQLCFEMRFLSEVFHKNSDCWRELAPSGGEGLHLLIGDDGNDDNDQIHIDTVDPYKTKKSDGSGECTLSMDGDTVEHLLQVLPGVSSNIYNPFGDLSDTLTKIDGLLQRGYTIDPWPGFQAEADTLHKSVADPMVQAVLGKPGWDQIAQKASEANELFGRMELAADSANRMNNR